MHIQERFIDMDRDVQYGTSDMHQASTDHVGELFRQLREEYGRCRSKVYVDIAEREIKSIGWVFEKRMKYPDNISFYLREVWVTLYDEHACSECGHLVYQYHYL